MEPDLGRKQLNLSAEIQQRDTRDASILPEIRVRVLFLTLRGKVECREQLGGLLRYYYREAA